MKSAGSMTDLPETADKRFSSSSPSPTSLSPSFTAAAAAGGSISGSPLNIDPSLLRYRRSCLNRLRLSSSASSNESPDSTSSAAAVVAARKRLLHILNFRSFSSSTRGSSPSPLSPIENLQALPPSARSSPAYTLYKTPVKVEVQEDVLVMDAISESMPGAGRARHPLKIISSSSSSSSSINNYSGGSNSSKTEMCQSWEEYGFCRFGSRCQFAHGKEELRRGSRPWKLKQSGSNAYDDKYLRYTSPAVTGSLLPNYEAAASTSAAPQVMRKHDINKVEIVAATEHPSLQQQEGGFSWPPTEAQEVEIQKVLYGPSQSRKRLPVFVNICSEPDPQL